MPDEDEMMMNILDRLVPRLIRKMQADFPGIEMAFIACPQCKECGGFHRPLQYGTGTLPDHRALMQRACSQAMDDTPDHVGEGNGQSD
jgi:hypothetical protein